MIICDGVGTAHLGYQVVKKAIALGMEILLRAPHLSFVLQGEDTINFKVKYMHASLLACLPIVVVVVVVVVVVAAARDAGEVAIDDDTVANAHANADVDDACSGAAGFA